MPGSCHGHRDTTAAPGDAPRGSAAGTGVQREDKQGPPGQTLSVGPAAPPPGLASRPPSDCQRLPERPPGPQRKIHTPPPKSAPLPRKPSSPAWPERPPPHHHHAAHSWRPAWGRSEVRRRLGRQASKAVKRAGKSFWALSKVRAQYRWGPLQLRAERGAGRPPGDQGGSCCQRDRWAAKREGSLGDPGVSGPCPTPQEETQEEGLNEEGPGPSLGHLGSEAP